MVQKPSCPSCSKKYAGVGGEDALAAGLQGKAVGDALRALEEWWMGEDFLPDREALLARLQARA